jgi:hypothetical protein
MYKEKCTLSADLLVKNIEDCLLKNMLNCSKNKNLKIFKFIIES